MIELTTTLLMLASAFTPATDKLIADAKGNGSQATTTIEKAISKDQFLTSVSVEAYVRDYFKDTPIMAEIAKCESTFRQFDSKGRTIRGIENDDDLGVMQINKFYHGEDAVRLGFDLHTIDGNLGYAKYLYEKYGDKPWVHSSKCWKKYREIAQK